MIRISKSPTADTRTCDWSKVSKEQLLTSSVQHIEDVAMGLAFFCEKLTAAATAHDFDKLTDIDSFYGDFVTGFTNATPWWKNHLKLNRHHINSPDGAREDVTLIDVLEHITDCVMAGMARSGSVYELKIDSALLQKAFKNTVELLKRNVEVRR